MPSKFSTETLCYSSHKTTN